MKCLNDVEIQTVADGEAPEAWRQHAAGCGRCGTRVRERDAQTAAILSAIDVSPGLPDTLKDRVERALAEGTGQGATRLRTGTVDPRRPWRAAVWSTAALAAATLVAVLFVAPLVKAPVTVSAAEVLAKSANRLAQPVASGIERLEYELVLDGVPREMMPDHVDGAYRVTEIIDHDTAGRYLMAAYGPGGELMWGVMQDPQARRRLLILRVDDQPYQFEFSLHDSMTLSAPEMERLHMEATVAMMQASGNQHLEVIQGSAGRQYRIDVPRIGGSTSNAVWDLSEARVLINAGDYHIVELAVKGTFLKRPYSVSYRLIDRVVSAGPDALPDVFDLPANAVSIKLQGEGSAVPVRDALVAALREIKRMQRER